MVLQAKHLPFQSLGLLSHIPWKRIDEKCSGMLDMNLICLWKSRNGKIFKHLARDCEDIVDMKRQTS